MMRALVVALLLGSASAQARPLPVVVVEGLHGGLSRWSSQDALFRGTDGRDDRPPTTQRALRRIEQKLDRLTVAFQKHALRRATEKREARDHRAESLMRSLWTVGDELAKTAAPLDPKGVAAAEVFRLVAKAFTILDDDEMQRKASLRGDFGGSLESADWGTTVEAFADACVVVSSAHLDLEAMNRCLAILSHAGRPNDVEIFAHDVPWQPALVAAR